jgi:hypothetical protein
VLFAGTETGLFVSLDAGTGWTRFADGFPTVPVDDLVIHPRDGDLVVGTHGRAIYVLDDVAPLAGMTSDVVASALHVFQPRPVTQFQPWKHESYSAQRVFIGPNPPYGAIVTYYLKGPDKGGASITIRDASGAVLRTLPGSADAGLNRIVWDLRSNAPPTLANQRGPLVIPGTYTATVQAGNRESKATITVLPDPEIQITDTERQQRYRFLTDALSISGGLSQSATEVRAVRDQLSAFQEQLKRSSGTFANLIEQAGRLDKTLAELQTRIGGGGGGGEEGGGGGGGLRGRANALFSELDGSGIHQGTLTGPTEVQRQRLEALKKDAEALRTSVSRALDADLGMLNTEIAKQNVPRLVRPR